MLKVVQEDSKNNVDVTAAGGSLLDVMVWDGARAMLAAALQAEVAAYIDAHVGELDEAGRRLVVRNGRVDSPKMRAWGWADSTGRRNTSAFTLLRTVVR